MKKFYLSSLFIKEKQWGRYQMLIFLTVFLCLTMKNTKAMNPRPFASLMTFYSVYKKSGKRESFAAGAKKFTDIGCVQGTINYKIERHHCKLWHRNSRGTKAHHPFATATRSHNKWQLIEILKESFQ